MMNFPIIQYQPNFQRIKGTEDLLLKSTTIYFFPFGTTHIRLKNGLIGVFRSDCLAPIYISSNSGHFIAVPRNLVRICAIQMSGYRERNERGWIYGEPAWYNVDNIFKIIKSQSVNIVCFRQNGPDHADYSLVLFLKAVIALQS
jgi:hypothetical protein